jgi:hypothetical protein
MTTQLQTAAAQNGAAGMAAATQTKVVTVVKVKTPWYGFGFMLKRAFKDAVPTYQKAAGLQTKFFHLSDDGKYFGGIYLWQDKASAQNWFNDKWFARVREKYNDEGRVEYLTLIQEKVFAPANYDYAAAQDGSRVLRVRNVNLASLADATAKAEGLLRMLVAQHNEETSALLLFATDKQATEAAKLFATPTELFETPVLLFNK